MDTLRKQECLFYTVVWVLVFAIVPLVMLFHVLMGHDGVSALREVWLIWRRILPFFLLFLVHDLALSPLLEKRKIVPYILLALALMVVFGLYCFLDTTRPPGVEMAPPFTPLDRPAPPDGRRPVEPEVMKVAMGFLVLFANLGVKAYFRARRGELRMAAIQADSVARQLETLRYQINPHFFMNTLNNIHALVDIDPEAAKSGIEEFSKLMRIVLYEGNAPTIPLETELDFLKHYVSLMRLRYPSSVEISLSVPESTAGAVVPPLVMASFVENAFKHGVSYESESFIRIKVFLDDGKTVFTCANSRHPSKGPVQHGIGLENVRKRLDIMYGDAYNLLLEEKPDFYGITLVIPSREVPS